MIAINPRVRGLTTSPTLAVQERCDAMARAGRPVFRLGLGQSPFPVPEVVVDALRVHAGKKEYLPVKGLLALREAVAEHHHRRHSVTFSPDLVLVGPGSKELMFVLQVVFDGEILIPTPAWVSYEPQARIEGRTATPIALTSAGGWRLSPEALDDICGADPERSRILILNYPANPTGVSYAPDELAALAEVARRRRIIVLSDEIYGELHYQGAHASIARFYPEGTIVSGGLSKWCGAGGWRLGTFAFPPALRGLCQAMAAVASETYTSTSAPIQYAAVRAFRGGLEVERYLAAARRILHALTEACGQRLLEAGARLEPPAGGFYLFPDLSHHRYELERRGVTTSGSLCSRLLEETGVAALPGSAFGCTPTEFTCRLALVDFDGARALAALDARPAAAPIDHSFLETHAAPVMTAIEVLCRWIEPRPRPADAFSTGTAPAAIA